MSRCSPAATPWTRASGRCSRSASSKASRLTRPDWLTVGYLAVAVTAAAFVLWYSSVSRLGASRAGLLTGIAPAAGRGGIAVVAAGLALGFRKGTR